MGGAWKAPGTCADCGNDAFIRLGIRNGAEDMVCAHCYAERMRKGLIPKPRETAHFPPRISGIRPR
jgi:hypothetical protein